MKENAETQDIILGNDTHEENHPVPYPHEIFADDEIPVVPLSPKPTVQQESSDKMIFKIPDYRPYRGSGRLVCQAFTRKKSKSGDIIFVSEAGSKTIPKNTTIIVVRKDEDIRGIDLFDEVVFADEFVPAQKSLPWENSMETYYVPHYLDVILINRVGEKITIPSHLLKRVDQIN